jgi:Fe-S oxidoreductase
VFRAASLLLLAGSLVTADPGCLMQMRGMLKDHGIRMEHLAVVLEELTR